MAARVRLIIAGRVQGVAYRYSAAREAKRLNLCGWVRNLHDGRVEALVQGDESEVEKMIRWCRQGPPGARVDSVESYPEQASDDLYGFDITF